jgi:hypothetical protein
MPDQFVMSKEEYYGYFPYDVYKNEDEKSNWALGEKVTDMNDSTSANGEWSISNNITETGWYKILQLPG